MKETDSDDGNSKDPQIPRKAGEGLTRNAAEVFFSAEEVLPLPRDAQKVEDPQISRNADEDLFHPCG